MKEVVHVKAVAAVSSISALSVDASTCVIVVRSKQWRPNDRRDSNNTVSQEGAVCVLVLTAVLCAVVVRDTLIANQILLLVDSK